MSRKYALLLAILITGLIASNAFLFSLSSSYSSRETVRVERVIDGDTLVLDDGRTLRLSNINTPEKNEKGYQEALEFLKNYENLTLELETLGVDRYQRTLGRIYTPDYLNLEIVKSGIGRKFLVHDSEKSDFADAEEYAIKNSLGIWSKSEHYGCFKAKINPEKEIISLLNICETLSMQDWTIKDESRKTYKLPDIALGKVNINSENGEDNETDLFWNSKTNIWNNDRDTLYLFDKDNDLAHYQPYGY